MFNVILIFNHRELFLNKGKSIPQKVVTKDSEVIQRGLIFRIVFNLLSNLVFFKRHESFQKINKGSVLGGIIYS